MASFDVAAKATNQALIFPALIVGEYLERSKTLSNIPRKFHDAPSLPGNALIQLKLEDGKVLADKAIVQHFLELANSGAHDQRASFIQTWVERSFDFTATDFQSLRKPFDELDSNLALRTHIVGYSLSIADLAVWATIRGNKVAHNAVKRTSINLARWYSYIESINPWVTEIYLEMTSSTLKKIQAASAAGASFDIDLPQVNGPMVTRFPPEPSGYLHIGHSKAALLNDYFAHKKPGGTLICRFDDTNPSKESMEFQDSILQDLKSMEIVPDKTSYSSDYFQEMYELAIALIKDGKAFADDSELGKGDESRRNRLPSKRRDLSIEETLARFADMKGGSTEGQRWCLRARIAYDHDNGTLRDPVIYRCNQISHHRTGTKWKIYPTYDFCAPILDALEGITVALRTNEYRDRNVQYEWMQEALGLRQVKIWDFSRMNFIRTVLSKRKLTRIVDDGKVTGWDDPRMPTIRGILRRGMTVPALREFILKQGPSRNILNLEWGAFWALNKKYIDNEAPRFTAIDEDNVVRCSVSGVDASTTEEKPRHAKNAKLGTKKVLYSNEILIEQADAATFEKDEEITLMNWGNAIVRSITKSSEPSKDGTPLITGLEMDLHLSGDFKKTKKKITWLSTSAQENLVPLEYISFDYLITKDKLEKEDTLEDFLTPVTEWRTRAVADVNVSELKAGQIVQLDRKGYFRIDRGVADGRGRVVVFNIPTGKD